MAAVATVGLDIGSHAIKVAEVVPGKAGATVKALGMAPTPKGAIENGAIVDAQLIADAIKELLKECRIATRTCVSSVSGQGALVVRVIEVPKMTDAELADQMKWEIERHVPFAANDTVMDYLPIQRPDAPEDAQNMDVLLAVAQQDMIDSHIDVLLKAGLKPIAVDVEPLAASRALIELGPDPYGAGKTYVIVNIGSSNTDLAIIQNGILAFPRNLPLAGLAMTQAIAAAKGIEEDEAEALKCSVAEVISVAAGAIAAPAGEGFMDFSVPSATAPAGPAAFVPFDFSDEPDTAPIPEPAPAAEDAAPGALAPVEPTVAVDPEKAQLASAIAPTLTELLGEIRRSLEYYRGRNPDANVDGIILCGGGARLKNLATLIKDDLGIDAFVADPLAHAERGAAIATADFLKAPAPEYAVAVGLAVRDMIEVPAPPTTKRKRGKK